MSKDRHLREQIARAAQRGAAAGTTAAIARRRLIRAMSEYDSKLPPAVRSAAWAGTRTGTAADDLWVQEQLSRRQRYFASLAARLGLELEEAERVLRTQALRS